LKKYPFSRKAINAILAATVALTPIVTTSVIIKPSNVEAATVSQEIDALAERFFVFYKHASKYGFTGTPTTAINSLDYAKILSTATTNGISLNVPTTKQADFENLMKNTATLIYTKHNSAGDLATAIKNFKTANSPYFQSLFNENGDVFADQLILFVKDLEGQLELAIMDATTPTFAAVISDAVNKTFQNGANKAQYANLDGKLGNVGLSVQSLFLLQEKLNDSVVDPNKTLRSALMQSAFEAKGAYIDRNLTNNEFTLFVPVKFINSDILVGLKGSLNWKTSNESIAKFTGNVLTPVSNGTVTVFATLDGIKLASFPNVAVSVTPPGNGDGGTKPVPELEPRPDDGNPQLPKDATELRDVKLPSGLTEVYTVVKPDKVTEITSQLTAAKNTIQVNLQVPKTGEIVKASLPGSLFTEAAKKDVNAVVEIKTDNASYNLPVSQIDIDDLAKQLNVDAKDVQIVVSVNVVERAQVKDGITVVSKVIEYTVEAVSSKDSKNRIEIKTFNEYVERTIFGDKDFVSNNSVGVKINEKDGSVTSVPTLFDGKDATFKSLTNSKYAVIENFKTFPDVDNKSWAENYIETLASKLIINGKTDGNYAPGEEMTRAQFTVLLVKALGLPGGTYEQKFKDVKEADWFNLNGELAAAIKTGIIQGKPDGRFAPNEKITRTQAAIMLNRAMKLGFINYDMTKLKKTKTIADFKDTANLDTEAKAAIEAVYQAGIISGKPDGTFDPMGNTKRDQMAKMLAEFLISAKLMNEIK
jgi:hypothetical protein